MVVSVHREGPDMWGLISKLRNEIRPKQTGKHKCTCMMLNEQIERWEGGKLESAVQLKHGLCEGGRAFCSGRSSHPIWTSEHSQEMF